MKTLFRKDLRENLRLSLTCFAIFSLMLMAGYETCINALKNLLSHNFGATDVSALQPLLSTTVLVETLFFCAGLGAGLGWLQTRNEAHRDLWAFLIHRPMTRSQIFRSKAAAGLCLYFFAAGLPLLILIAVVRAPGHIPMPFEWAMTFPLISFFLTGIAYYFAGLLTGLRQARWFGSRCFGLGLAIIASAVAFNVEEFWQSLLATLAVIVILAASAWGAYQSGGFYRGQPIMGRLATIAAITVGCSVALYVVAGLIVLLALEPFSKRSWTYTRYQIVRSGQIYKVTETDNEQKKVTDLDGHLLISPETGKPMDQLEFQKQWGASLSVLSTLKEDKTLFSPHYLSISRFFDPCCLVNKKLWYMDRHGNILGYDGVTRKFIGELEPHGFDGTSPKEQFVRSRFGLNSFFRGYDNSPSFQILATAKTVYRIDFKAATLKPIYALTNDDEIGGCSQSFNFGGSYDQITKETLITTSKSVQLLNSDGDLLLETPYTPSYSEYPRVSLFYLTKNIDNVNWRSNSTYAVWFYPDWQSNRESGWKMPEYVRWLSADNLETRKMELPTLRDPDSAPSWPDKVFAMLAPHVVPTLVDVFTAKTKNLFKVLPYCVLDVLLAAIGWGLARRYNFSTAASIVWTMFILLFGIPGLLGFLCVQDWPGREACPNCKKLRTVDREFCEHCDAPFPPPEKNGTEIFAPLIKA